MELGGPSGPQSPQGPCVRWRRRGLDSAMCSWPPAPNAWGYRGHLSVTPARKSLRARSPLSWVATASCRCHLTPVTRPLLSSWWKTSGSRAGSGGIKGAAPPTEEDGQLEGWDPGPGLSVGRKGASSLPDSGRSATGSDPKRLRLLVLVPDSCALHTQRKPGGTCGDSEHRGDSLCSREWKQRAAHWEPLAYGSPLSATAPRCCQTRGRKVPESLSRQTLSSVRPRLVLTLLVLTSH